MPKNIISMTLGGLKNLRTGKAGQRAKEELVRAHYRAHGKTSRLVFGTIPYGKRPPTRTSGRGQNVHMRKAYNTKISPLKNSLYYIDTAKAHHARAYYEGSGFSTRPFAGPKPMKIPVRWWPKALSGRGLYRWVTYKNKAGVIKKYAYPRRTGEVIIRSRVDVPSRAPRLGLGYKKGFVSSGISEKVRRIYETEFGAAIKNMQLTMER